MGHGVGLAPVLSPLIPKILLTATTHFKFDLFSQLAIFFF